MTEAQIQKAVLDHWKVFGLPDTLVAAVPNAGAKGQYGLTRGLFDLVVIGGDFLEGRTGWIELKTERGKLSEHQISFREKCLVNGVPHAVAYGRDEPIRLLEEWQIVRRSA